MAPLEMLPNLPVEDIANGLACYAVAFGQRPLRDDAGNVQAPDLSYLLFVQLCLAVCRPNQDDAATLAYHVRVVVGRRAQEQVRRVDAASDIASMQNPHSFWNGPMRQLPAYAVCAALTISRNGNRTIPIRDFSCSPDPARTQLGPERRNRAILIHLRPKPNRERRCSHYKAICRAGGHGDL